MPQVELSLPSVCTGDSKVACETLAAGDPPENPPIVAAALDYAPESFFLSRDAELEWLSENAYIERKDSGKGGGGSILSLPNQNPNPNPNSSSTSSSQRYSVNLKSKASIIGLPKPQKQSYDRKSCKAPASIRLFPKRSGPVPGKPVVAVSEPGSPKVSCMGRVRSRKDRRRSRKKDKTGGGERKPGGGSLWANFRSMFRRGRLERESMAVEERERESSSAGKKKKRSKRFEGKKTAGEAAESPVEPPGLEAMKRFASGRKSDAWAGDVEDGGAKSEPLDRGSPIWRRRREKAGDPHMEVDVNHRDWQSVGPASV